MNSTCLSSLIHFEESPHLQFGKTDYRILFQYFSFGKIKIVCPVLIYSCSRDAKIFGIFFNSSKMIRLKLLSKLYSIWLIL